MPSSRALELENESVGCPLIDSESVSQLNEVSTCGVSVDDAVSVDWLNSCSRHFSGKKADHKKDHFREVTLTTTMLIAPTANSSL